MFALFLELGARTRPQDLWPFLISETRLKFLIWTQIGPVLGQSGHPGSCKEALSLQVDKHTKPQATAPPSLGAVPWRGLEECVPLHPLELRVFRGCFYFWQVQPCWMGLWERDHAKQHPCLSGLGFSARLTNHMLVKLRQEKLVVTLGMKRMKE